VVDAPVYLFTPGGSYLGKSETTDASGIAQFLLPDQQYKFRVDYDGSQYWSDVVTIIPHEENSIELNLDLLALDLTNDPHPARYHGIAPELEPEKSVVALLSALPGLWVDSAYAQGGTEAIYFFINDHLGTPQKMVDESGVVVWDSDYNPFGEVGVTTSTYDNKFRFPGQYYDQESGLHYNWHRYYDPKIGRYLRPDPIGLAGGINLFWYVDNNPINSTDPEGLHGPVLFGRTPWFFRIPILRKFSRVPPPRGLPKETPVSPRRVQPERSPDFHRDLGGPRDDLWWQQDPYPPLPKPYNPNKPIIPIAPNLDPIPMSPASDDPCEEKKEAPVPWEEIPWWMKS